MEWQYLEYFRVAARLQHMTRAAKRLGVTEIDQLRTPQCERVKARDAGAALARGVRIVQGIVVEEIVSRQQAQAFVIGVHFEAALVVAHGLAIGAGSKRGRPVIGKRNVLQQVLSRRGPDILRNDGARKNTL